MYAPLKRSPSHANHAAQKRTHYPAIRAEIAASNESTRALAKRFGVSELTIAKWRKRASVNDLPHTPHRLQTTLSPAQEAIVVELRKSLLLPVDDLVAVTKEFICPKASRCGLDAKPLFWSGQDRHSANRVQSVDVRLRAG